MDLFRYCFVSTAKAKNTQYSNLYIVSPEVIQFVKHNGMVYYPNHRKQTQQHAGVYVYFLKLFQFQFKIINI